jgi:hypothetical protein
MKRLRVRMLSEGNLAQAAVGVVVAQGARKRQGRQKQRQPVLVAESPNPRSLPRALTMAAGTRLRGAAVEFASEDHVKTAVAQEY